MYSDFLFYMGLALLLTHELDAIQKHEWRLFPGLSLLRDETAYYIFVIFHVPLFLLLLWLIGHPSASVRFWFQAGLDIFLVFHLGLHLLFYSHNQNEFKNVFSQSIIAMMALTGVVHLIGVMSKI